MSCMFSSTDYTDGFVILVSYLGDSPTILPLFIFSLSLAFSFHQVSEKGFTTRETGG